MTQLGDENSTIALSPRLSLYLLSSKKYLLPASLRKAFAKGSGSGLRQLGLWGLDNELPLDLAYCQEFSKIYFSHLCSVPEVDETQSIQSIFVSPPLDELTDFLKNAPLMVGGEYLSEGALLHLRHDLENSFREELGDYPGSLQEYFKDRDTVWSLFGRVCFHLVENKEDESAPFAFLATYIHKLSDQGKPQYLPLGQALKQYSGVQRSKQLLQLLLPIQKASEKSQFLKSLVDSKEIFHPLAWTPSEASQFLKEIPLFESSRIMIRVPDWWKAKRPTRPQVTVAIGGKRTSAFGADSLLQFSVDLTLEGERLTEKEINQILSSKSGLVLIRGKWAELDREKLSEIYEQWKIAERSVEGGELSFIEGMRLLAGASSLGQSSDSSFGFLDHSSSSWMKVVATQELSKILNQLRDPSRNLEVQLDLGGDLKGSLRPYQQAGVKWL